MSISVKAQAFQDLMVEAATEFARGRGWDQATSVYLFVPQYVIAALLGVDPSTVRRWFYRYPTLKHRVNMSSHSAIVNGKRMKDGCLWVVALREQGGPLRFHREALEHGYRDFEGDMLAGRTLHGPSPTTTGSEVDTILAWCNADWPPPLSDGPCSVPEAVQSVVVDARNVLAAAAVIVRELQDHGRERLWMKLLWRVVHGNLTAQALIDSVQRSRTDVLEGFGRSAARLATSRLRFALA